MAGRPSGGETADQTLVRAAITNLSRVGLISIDPADAIRTVRMHPSVQAAVRAYLPPEDYEQAVLAAAEALLQAWPDADGAPHAAARTRLRRRLQNTGPLNTALNTVLNTGLLNTGFQQRRLTRTSSNGPNGPCSSRRCGTARPRCGRRTAP